MLVKGLVWVLLQLHHLSHQKKNSVVIWYTILPAGIVNDLFVISCYSDLSKLYTLLKHIPRGLQAMVTELEEHITKTGKNLQTVILFSCHLQCNSHDLKSTKQAGGVGGGEGV